MSYNKITLIGNLGRDPESKTFESGATKVKVSIATSEKIKDEYVSDWHNLEAWGKTGELLQKHFKKGDTVMIEGKQKNTTYSDRDGMSKNYSYVAVEKIVWLPKTKPQTLKIYPEGEPKDDIPFF